MSEPFLPTEVVQQIASHADFNTNVNCLLTCKVLYKLSQDVDFWSNKAENKQLCEKTVFEEFHRFCSVITNKNHGDIREQISYIMQTLIDEIVINSNNAGFIIMIKELNGSFKCMNDKQIIKILLLLTTSMISLYKYFDEKKRWNKQCISINFQTSKQCFRKSLLFCHYCLLCNKSGVTNSCSGVEMPLIYGCGTNRFIKIKTSDGTRTLRDIATNYVFLDKYPNRKLIGKMFNRCIEPITEDDREKAKIIYKEPGIMNYLI